MSESGPQLEWEARAAAVVDPQLAPWPIPDGLLFEVFQHALECHPEEACGLLLGAQGTAPTRVERCTNVQNRRRADGLSELDARHGYWIDEGELLRALRGAERGGEKLLVIYHSHVDTAAYFSHADLDAALGPDQRPLYPGVAQLVLSVYEDGVRDSALFLWDADTGSFAGRRVERAAS